MSDNGGGVATRAQLRSEAAWLFAEFFSRNAVQLEPFGVHHQVEPLCGFDKPRVSMGEVVRLSLVRKQAARRARELRAVANRIVFGRPKAERKLAEAQREKASRELEALRLDTGEDR